MRIYQILKITAVYLATSALQIAYAQTPLDQHSRVGLSETSFIQREDAASVNNEARVSAKFKLNPHESARWQTGVDAGGSFAAGLGAESMWEIPEAYLSFSPSPTNQTRTVFTLGRKKEKWSELDSDWTLGLWQPFHRFDSLRSTEQGLAGAFTDYHTDGFQVIAFASPFFIPEQGPAFELTDGRLTSRNPWFSEPTDKLVLFGKDTDLRYSIDMPDAASVIAHPQAGILTRFGSSLDGPSLQLAYTKKPRNQLALPFDGALNISHDRAQVRLAPQVVYHNMASADFYYRSNEQRFGISALADISDEPVAPKGFTYEKLQPLYLLSPTFETRLLPSITWGPHLKLSYLDSIGGEVEMHGPLSTDRDPFSPTAMYRRAGSVELQSRLWQKANLRLEQSVKWIEEFAERGRIFMIDTALTSRESWRWLAYLDVLASDQPEDSNPGFISRYRGNDRVGTQINFYF